MAARKKAEPKAAAKKTAATVEPGKVGGPVTDEGGRPVTDAGGRILNHDTPDPS